MPLREGYKIPKKTPCAFKSESIEIYEPVEVYFFSFVNVCFFSLFGAKHNYNSPTSSESAKDLVRKSVLDEKLECGGNCNSPYMSLRFSVQVSMFSLMFAFFSLFGKKHKNISPTSFESAKDMVRISVLEEKLGLWWKLQFAE